MLHILWILIKFILIFLGILVGLVLLGVLLVLFCPVRYRGQASKESAGLAAVQADARVTWLFGAIGAEISYKEDGVQLVIRIFGISLDKIRSWREHWREKRKKKTLQKSRKKAFTKETPAEAEKKPKMTATQSGQPESAPAKSPKTESVTAEKPKRTTVETSTDENQAGFTSESQTASGSKEKEDSFFTSSGKKENSLFARAREVFVKLLKKLIGIPAGVWNGLVSFIKSILQKIRKIRDTISGIRKRLDWWKAFLGDERTKAALSLIKKDAKGLVRHVLPTKVEGHVTFGCEDPAITGTALAVLGMTFPFHKNRIQVDPLFDGENQLTGNVSLKGRIYGIVLVKTVLEIYINKNVKFVIDGWKHKEDESWKTKTILKKQ